MHTTTINHIAKQILARKESGEKPYLLFLGAGVSISSGVSNINDMIDQFLIDFGLASHDTIEEMDRDERFAKFISKMENLSEFERYIWLQAGFKDGKPSDGYVALTRLIEEGFFDVIFTTNWDNFLDISLERSIKIKNKRDFRFYVRGVDQNDFIIHSFQRSIPQIKILKLHGDLASRIIFVTRKETANFAKDFAAFLKDSFRRRNLMMIGYSILETDVQECIESNSNTIIYINPNPPSDQIFNSFISKFKQTQQISGRDAEFDVFMTKLRKILLNETFDSQDDSPIER